MTPAGGWGLVKSELQAGEVRKKPAPPGEYRSSAGALGHNYGWVEPDLGHTRDGLEAAALVGAGGQLVADCKPAAVQYPALPAAAAAQRPAGPADKGIAPAVRPVAALPAGAGGQTAN